jgi:hypothetical protein
VVTSEVPHLIIHDLLLNHTRKNFQILQIMIDFNENNHIKCSNPRNCADEGPISRILLASASPSIRGGGWVNFSFFTSLQVIRVGIQALPGGMMIRTPECRQPLIAPPRASTMKLTRKLKNDLNCKSHMAQLKPNAKNALLYQFENH